MTDPVARDRLATLVRVAQNGDPLDYLDHGDLADYIADRLLAAGVLPPDTLAKVLDLLERGKTFAARALLREAASDTTEPPANLDARTLLGYLWDATGKNPGTRVRDLFAENDPLVADVERALAVPPQPPPGLRERRVLANLLRMTQHDDYEEWADRLAECGVRGPSEADIEDASEGIRVALAETPGGAK